MKHKGRKVEKATCENCVLELILHEAHAVLCKRKLKAVVHVLSCFANQTVMQFLMLVNFKA